jgi:hypothetical protein
MLMPLSTLARLSRFSSDITLRIVRRNTGTSAVPLPVQRRLKSSWMVMEEGLAAGMLFSEVVSLMSVRL